MVTQEIIREGDFTEFRKNIIGTDKYFVTPYGLKKLVYADWTASGRLYHPIERRISEIGELLGNTHSPTTITGSLMTKLYENAKKIIKNHVNAGNDYILISAGSGMTGAVNKFQRILGFKLHERFRNLISIDQIDRPLVFVTHMEHHSNQTSWLETVCEVKIIKPNENGQVDLDHFKTMLEENKNRKFKIASVTACSNVTGIQTPIHEIAKLIHRFDGLCFVDFACSAPYVNIDMKSDNEAEKLDAIFFSPHKFLGGPGTSGILIFDKKLYHNSVPDNPGGGTVDWTNPWGEHKFHDDIEAREDGGTPPFLQMIRTSLCVRLKENMGIENILSREDTIVEKIMKRLDSISNIQVLAQNNKERLGVFSFYIPGLHHDLGVKIFNDRYGIQFRSGCSCAGTYGHYLLNIDIDKSHEIVQKINNRNFYIKPGWIRMSIHPTMTDSEVDFVLDAIEAVSINFDEWSHDYDYDNDKNEFYHKTNEIDYSELIDSQLSI